LFITEVMLEPAIALAAAKAPPPSKNKPRRAKIIIAAIIPAAITGAKMAPPIMAQFNPSWSSTQAQISEELVILAVAFGGGQ